MLLLTYFCSMDILQDIPVMVSQMKLRWKIFQYHIILSQVSGINLVQLGVTKIKSFPFTEITVKSLYTMVFFATMRIMIQQQSQAEEISTDSTEAKSSNSQNGFLKKTIIMAWSWILLLILFGYAFLEGKITIIKIAYMGLFFIFNVLFQVSF